MDILSERGQQTALDEQEAARIWHRNFPTTRYIETPKDQPAIVDAVIANDKNKLLCVAETKCRYDMDINKFVNEYEGQWLITFEKLDKASKIAASLCVPLVGFLYIVPSKTLLFKKLTDNNGQFSCSMNVAETVTQATCNGGVALRKNAYVDMSDARKLR